MLAPGFWDVWVEQEIHRGTHMMNCKEAGKYRLLDYLIVVPCPEYEPGSNLGLQERLDLLVARELRQWAT